MDKEAATIPAVITIFGVTGDLANRKLLPALYHLFTQNIVEPRSVIIGIGRKVKTREQFWAETKISLQTFYRGHLDEKQWELFAERLFYEQIQFSEVEDYKKLAYELEELDKEANEKFTRIFYFSTPASLYETIVENLGESNIVSSPMSRIVIEKPFGSNLQSAKALNETLTKYVKEEQIYRIDHYLGKEVVQNIMAFRFANGIFEPIWNRNYIDNVQITVAESIGIENRGAFYEETGALKDFAQNHMLQLISHIAMEQPQSLEAESIREERIRVLENIVDIDPKQIDGSAIRGQYDQGIVNGELQEAYRKEDKVAPNSNVETFFAMKLFIENERWAGVPFYLRHGKRLSQRVSEIAIQFKNPPQHLFETQPNVLVLRIQPDEQVGVRIVVKKPGLSEILTPVDMHINYEETFEEETPEAYEKLILDVIEGNQMLFIRNDAMEKSWEIIDNVVEGWQHHAKKQLAHYPAGSWGPELADEFIQQDGRVWLLENPPAKVSFE